MGCGCLQGVSDPGQSYEIPAKRREEPQVRKVTSQNYAEDRAEQIQAEKIRNSLQLKCKKYEEDIRSYEAKIESKMATIKELMSQGKKKEAKRIAEGMKRMQKQLENIQIRKNVLEDNMYNVNNYQKTKDVVYSQQEAQQFIKEDITSKLQDQIFTLNEQTQMGNQMNVIMKQRDDNGAGEYADDILKKVEMDIAKRK